MNQHLKMTFELLEARDFDELRATFTKHNTITTGFQPMKGVIPITRKEFHSKQDAIQFVETRSNRLEPGYAWAVPLTQPIESKSHAQATYKLNQLLNLLKRLPPNASRARRSILEEKIARQRARITEIERKTTNIKKYWLVCRCNQVAA